MAKADRPAPFLLLKLEDETRVDAMYSCNLCHIMFKPGDKVMLLVEDVQGNEMRLQLCHDDCSLKWSGGRYAGEPKEEHEERMRAERRR